MGHPVERASGRLPRSAFVQQAKGIFETVTDIETRLSVLSRIYTIYDDFISNYDMACEKHCCTCCTCNVTATTLEGINIIRYLDASGEKSFSYECIVKQAGRKRFQPLVTTNGMVQLYAEGRGIPEEANDPQWGPCPLLEDTQCPVYAVRPFGCRCMVSRHPCAQHGHAEMDPLIVTVSNVCLQVIEHVDAGGYYGNLIDILMALQSGHKWFSGADKQPTLSCASPGPCDGLLLNQPLQQLMVPPEHAADIKPLIDALQTIRI